MRLTVARVKPTPAAIAPCLMPSRASANTSCLIPIGVGQGIVRTIRKTFEKICKYWLKVVTVWRLMWGNDHLYCGFGARRSHLTLHWMSAQGSVGFRWGTITGPYHANFSQMETQKFDPHWFYCLQWGCNNLFCQECISITRITFPKTNYHEDIIKWKHFPRYWPFVRGINRSPVQSPHKGQWRGAWCFLWSAPKQKIEQTIKRRWFETHRDNYDTTAMILYRLNSYKWHLLLTWFNFNLSMDKKSYAW